MELHNKLTSGQLIIDQPLNHTSLVEDGKLDLQYKLDIEIEIMRRLLANSSAKIKVLLCHFPSTWLFIRQGLPYITKLLAEGNLDFHFSGHCYNYNLSDLVPKEIEVNGQKKIVALCNVNIPSKEVLESKNMTLEERRKLNLNNTLK